MAGRPSKYKVEYVEQARKLCLLGYTNEQLANHFSVAGSTIDKWISEKPEFSGALREGKADADGEVADSLYKEALKGNVTACIFWLKNRQSQLWRDKQEVDNTHSVKPEELLQAFNEACESLERPETSTE